LCPAIQTSNQPTNPLLLKTEKVDEIFNFFPLILLGQYGPFHQSLVLSGQVVSEDNIFSNCLRTDDRRKVMTKAQNYWANWNLTFLSPLMAPFQICVRKSRHPNNMATVAKNRKGG
jgi:hypothetical protein